MTREPEELSVKCLLGNEKYVIPLYQRNYAWGEPEMMQLIRDIADYAKDKKDSHYYLGTLVVYEREGAQEHSYETIDGQQRLTTLTILACALKNHFSGAQQYLGEWEGINLAFDARPQSTETLQAIFRGDLPPGKDYQANLQQAYADARKLLNSLVEQEQLVPDFCEYLLHQVKILRVSVPPDTDLNHYFEIMNNRGEQLEKHEILKSALLEKLKEDKYTASYHAFHQIWEACSNMDKYVQYGFKPDKRARLFGKGWDCFLPGSFKEVVQAVYKEQEQGPEQPGSEEGPSLRALLEEEKKVELKTEGSGEHQERFSSVINFENFLLHVLKILKAEKGGEVPLDDKRLIGTFKKYLNKEEEGADTRFVMEFGFCLLKCRFLFDKYIIKREFTHKGDGWSLQEMVKNNSAASFHQTFNKEEEEGDNKTVLMLQAMFHVSAPTLIYKHWLNAALKWVYNAEETSKAGDYIHYLEGLAKAYLGDHFLSRNPKSYPAIIYDLNGSYSGEEIDLSLLNKGLAVENFIFNYLDYLLWRERRADFNDFEFTFRSSVEHFYPQHPIGDYKELDKEIIDGFGNICLISSSQNSRLSNFMPSQKVDYFQQNPSKESIKQKIMMDKTKAGWGEGEIGQHAKEMEAILQAELIRD